MTDYPGRWGQFAITVEGVGTPGGLYHFALGNTASFGFDPSLDPDGLYLEALKSYPLALEQSVDFVTQTVASGSLEFALHRTTETLREFHSLSDRPVAKLLLAADRTQTTIRFNKTTLAGTVVHRGREAIVVGTHTSSGIYTGCVRGALDTIAQAHSVEDGANTDCYARPSARSLQGRVVRWYFVPFDADPFTGRELQWSGVLHSVTSPAPGTLSLQVDDALQRLKNTYLFRKPWTFSNEIVSTGGNLPDHAPTGGYLGTPGGTQKLLVYVEGEGAYIAGWSKEGLTYGLTSAGIPSRKPFAGQPIPEIEYPATFREIVSTHRDQPDGSASPSTNTLPLSQRAGVLAVQLMTTTPSGGNFEIGGTDYDLGKLNLSGATRHDLVNTAAFLDWQNQFAIWNIDNLHLGIDGKQNLFDTIQGYKRPFGASLSTDAQGLISVVQIKDTPDYGATAQTITQDLVMPESLVVDRRLQDSLSRVEVAWGHIPGQDPQIEELRLYQEDGDNPLIPEGQSVEVEFDAPFLNASAAQGSGAALLARFGIAPPVITLSCARVVTASVGDVVYLSHDLLVADGTIGATNAVCLVTGRRERIDEEEHALDLTLLYVGLLYRNQGYWAPAATVAGYNAGTRTFALNNADYTGHGPGPFDSDAESFPAGALVKLVDQYYTLIEDGLVVDGDPVGNALTVTVSPSATPAAGDILVLSAWTSAYAGTGAGRFAAIADSDGELDSDPDNAYQWGL